MVSIRVPVRAKSTTAFAFENVNGKTIPQVIPSFRVDALNHCVVKILAIAIGGTLNELVVIPFADVRHGTAATKKPEFALPRTVRRRPQQFEHDVFRELHTDPIVLRVDVDNDRFKLILLQAGNAVRYTGERLVP